MDLSSFGVVEVSQRKRSYLFRHAIRTSRRAVKKTKHLLTQIQSLHPPTSQEFTLRDPGRSQAPFRLLCENSVQIRYSSDHTFESFIALSYCWHSSEWTTANCLGQVQTGWPICPRMLCGLLDERESPDQGVWIDALCIDQENKSEKKHAIGCMDLVYKSARKVVIGLEDIIISAKEAKLLQALLRDRDYEFSELKEHDMHTVTLLLIRILSARWFTRAWCSHELQVGIGLIFLIPTTSGIHKLPPASLEDLYSISRDFRENHQDLSELYDEIYESYDFLSRSIFLAEDRVERSLMSEFNDNMKLKCTVESDKISISINTAGLQLLFSGLHESRDKCRWILAMIALSSGDATVLGSVEEQLKFDGDNHTDHAESWVHWQDEFEDPMTDFGGSRLREPSCITAIDPEHITLDLLCFRACIPKKPTSHSLQCAGIFVDVFHNLCKSNNRYSVLDQGPAYKNSITEVFACSLDFGLD